MRRLATAVRVHTRTCTADLTFLLPFLRFVWNQNVGWGGVKEHGMALVRLLFTEVTVRAMQQIKDSQYAKVLVEPA